MAHDPELNAVFWTFPNDGRLTRLAAVWRTPGALTWPFALAWSTCRLVAYAPERSAMMECLGPGGEILGYAKACTRGADTRQVAVCDTLWRNVPEDDPDLRLPRLMAYAQEEQLLLFEPIAGDRLAELRYQRLIGLISSTQERQDSDAFLAGYAAIRLVPAPTTLAWYTAAALLVERALAAVHGLRSEGLLHLDALLADAITLVN